MSLPTIEIGLKPTYIKLTEDIDIFSVFTKIDSSYDTCVILESLGSYTNESRHTIIGFKPEYTISAKGTTLTINDTPYEVENPYFALEEIMPAKTVSRRFSGGLIGYLAYDAIHYFEPSLNVQSHPDFDTFRFGVYTDGIVLDKLTNELFYFYYNKNRFDEIQHVISSKTKPPISGTATFINDTMTKEEHRDAVEYVKERIIAGDTFQCEVGFKRTYTVKGNPLAFYQRLRKVNPSPHMYYIKDTINGQRQILLGASPELLFRLRGREMETYPLAGTTKRGNDEQEDVALARELLHDRKELAEHNMLVDLQRNDLGKVAEFGSVQVRKLMDIKKLSHVQHISSEVTGLLRHDKTVFSALASNFPMGTLTGAPKIETMKIIDKNEPDGRGPYGGGVGYFGFDGDCMFAIPIRSFFIHKNNGFIQTCGGIVFDSDPSREYTEIQRKLAAMKQVLEHEE